MLPTRNARNGQLFTSDGRINIKNARYAEDDRPARSGVRLLHVPDLFTRLSAASFSWRGEINAATLNTLHNLHFYLDTLRRIREAIAFGRFESFRLEFHQRLSRQLGPFMMTFAQLRCSPWARLRQGGSPCGCSSSRSSLVLAIFYFIILLPAKRKQQKVQQFLDSLKVGDRVITTGGIYGQVTRLGEQSVQLQIADKIRIEVARASIGGYQGQPPVVAGRVSVTSCRTLRWKVITVVAVLLVFAAVGVYPIVATRYGITGAGLADSRRR